jgi:hypothetical protein
MGEVSTLGWLLFFCRTTVNLAREEHEEFEAILVLITIERGGIFQG